ncbi:hypothetical protein [Actinokineospora sp.]|uniref:hypothetical protein n=1 Tax=Actinokineospora sp. TaxID=1872133 RepID=UPI0040383D29
MVTALWIATTAIVMTFVGWRLRRADHTVSTILREERERTDLEPAEEPFPESKHDRIGRRHRSI